MNAQSPAQSKPSDPKTDDVAKVADKPKVTETPKSDAPAPVGAETPVGEVKSDAVEVKLVHPEHDATVTVIKPSADYTNYVRGYGYQEAK